MVHSRHYRLITALKRKIVLYFLGGEINQVSLNRREKSAHVSLELGVHSPRQYVEICDPRTNEIQGHYFNKRVVRLVPNVIVEPRQSLVYSLRGELIEESTCWPTSNVKSSFPWKPSPRKLKSYKELISLSSTSYYHWLIEDVPTLLASIKFGTDVPLLMLDEAPSYTKDLAKLLKINVINTAEPVIVENLILTEKSEDVGWPHPADISALEEFKLNIIGDSLSQVDLIYISRRSSKRSPENEISIENLFSNLGFKIVQTEKKSLLEQMQIFGKAKFIAGIHGAGLSNMVWANSATIVLDIANESYWTECFHRLAHLKKHIYETFVYDGPVDSRVDLKDLQSKVIEIKRAHQL